VIKIFLAVFAFFLSTATLLAQSSLNAEDFKIKGIILPKEILDKVEDYKQYAILHYNFDAYRNYSTQRKIQLQNGPVILLSSISEILKHGNNIDKDLIEAKRNEAIDTNLHEIVTLVDIGLQYQPKQHNEIDH
jgi:hypothetical protein